MDKEASRFDIELFADVLTDLDQFLATVAACTGLRFVTVFDAGQVLRQGLTTGAGANRWRSRRGSLCRRQSPGQFIRCGGAIAGQRFLEQIALLGRQRFAAGPETHPAQMSQFQREGLDLGLGGKQFSVAFGDFPEGFGRVFCA